MKNILFILDNYLPNASPNGICCSKIIDVLNKKYNVFILCFNNTSKKDNVYIDKIDIIDKKSKFFSKIFMHIKWFDFFSKYPPYARNNVIDNLLIKADEMIVTHNIDMVIAVHLPIESIIVGSILKEKFSNVIFVSYMLDSFSGGMLPKFVPKSISRSNRLRWEDNLLKSYDKIFLMNSSKNHHEKYSKNSKWISNALFVDIPLLEKKALLNSNKCINNKKIKMLYAGSLDKSVRDPSTIIKVLDLLKDNNFYCEFIGNCSCKDEFGELMLKYGDRLVFNDQVSYKDVEKKIASADILINIGNLNSNLIPSKIFEYMSYCKPILSTYNYDNEPSLKYLRDYPLSILIDDRELISKKELLNKIYFTLNKKINYNELFNIFENNVPNYFVKHIDRIFLERENIKND